MILSSLEYKFYKINIDFEYNNEIYNMIAEPYNTLVELKEYICKKIYPAVKNIHCFYNNIDLYEKEDEQICILFPLKKKIKIKLRTPSKENDIIKSYQHEKSKTSLIKRKGTLLLDSSSPFIKNFYLNKNNRKINNSNSNSNINNYNEIKKRLSLFSSLDISKTKINKRNKLFKHFKNNEHDYLKEEEKLYHNLNKNQYEEYKLLSNKLKLNEKEKENENKILIFNTDIKQRKKLKKLNKISFNIKEGKDSNKNVEDSFLSNHIRKNKILKILIEKEKEELLEKINKESQEKIEPNLEQKLDISKDKYEDIKETNINHTQKSDNNNDNDNEKENQILKDENYICSLCKNNIITDYCLSCNQFVCNNCIEKCKSEKHKTIEIKLNQDCFEIVSTYGLFIISDIENKIKNIEEYNKDFKLYDIKKKRDDLLSMLNELIYLYSIISKILKIIYKEKEVKIAYEKYNLDTNKIKEDINGILKKADSYIKSDKNYNSPKYKLLNLNYFFNLINEKENCHQLLTEKMKVYSLNSNINSNVEKSMNEIEELLKKISDKEKPFGLEGTIKDEYDRLIKENKNLIVKKEKKKILRRRRTFAFDTIDLSKLNIPDFQMNKPAD